MEKAMKFLKDSQDVSLATIGVDNKPKVRAFQIMLIVGNRIYFATTEQKEVYEQLEINPDIEFLALEDHISVRVSGRANFDVEDNIAKMIYDENPTLQKLYKDYQSLCYFYMTIERLDYYDLSVYPPIVESHTYPKETNKI